ncbi:hypothetical protein Taro_032966, partial [Colocasia esculenta]|nr:hypothetical protein [Colocasia esculenta]
KGLPFPRLTSAASLLLEELCAANLDPSLSQDASPPVTGLSVFPVRPFGNTSSEILEKSFSAMCDGYARGFLLVGRLFLVPMLLLLEDLLLHCDPVP